MTVDVVERLGQIDIYLLDQLIKGRIAEGDTILDAGCGYGRNLAYLLRSGFTVLAVDSDPDAVTAVTSLAAELAPQLSADNFRLESIEAMSFADGVADVVVSSAVLHFARDDAAFDAMLRGSWRVLRNGGVFFARLASTIGMENRVTPLGGRRHRLPDGTERYLVDEPLLSQYGRDLGGVLLDPLKTTVVQDQRCMTTWVMRKGTPI
jgi:SAM-dependent methyltransferase